MEGRQICCFHSHHEAGVVTEAEITQRKMSHWQCMDLVQAFQSSITIVFPRTTFCFVLLYSAGTYLSVSCFSLMGFSSVNGSEFC